VYQSHKTIHPYTIVARRIKNHGLKPAWLSGTSGHFEVRGEGGGGLGPNTGEQEKGRKESENAQNKMPGCDSQ